MSLFFTHEFEAALDRFGVGRDRKIWYRVVFMPSDLEPQLPFATYPRLRVDGEIADVPFNGAWIPAGDGRRYLIVSPELIKTAGLRMGDWLTVRFRIADQDHVDVPAALAAAVSADDALSRLWDDFTAGMKRALSHHVGSAKTDRTREKRVAEALIALTEREGRVR